MAHFLINIASGSPGIAAGATQVDDFWGAAETIYSDAEHTRVLRRVTAAAKGDAVLLTRALSSAADNIGSDSEMASFIQWVDRNHSSSLSQSGPADAFGRALGSVGSDHLIQQIIITVRRAGLDPLLSS